ncbi:MAG: hypothetical protein ACFFFT_09835 [Candidatus Thorarchaeota archaeon]
MKGLCYIVLIIGFFIFFQQNPLYAVIFIGIFIAGYLYVKSKRAGSSGGMFGFMKGNPQQQNNSFDDIITLMMLQQLFNTPGTNSPERYNDTNKEKSKEDQIEQTKQEVLELLDE